jgi:hypothetical protein
MIFKMKGRTEANNVNDTPLVENVLCVKRKLEQDKNLDTEKSTKCNILRGYPKRSIISM